ncbi:HupE/UreJ family protein [Nannocystis radixulma]|uniref:HupE/UreJ family protein n=1 Tax=Nannocystis radixulma TaxID=2995305 RepID=A0ABT5BI30_9BACT|nr:HupE/UreJ family protein [Nannocystis radixulma]MDC0673073.1 HupE/UreJ family protein [Nannocystis radixulma]
MSAADTPRSAGARRLASPVPSAIPSPGASPVLSASSPRPLRLAALLAALLAARPASAHEFRPAVLVLDESEGGRLDGRLELPPEPDARDLVVELPSHCRPLPAPPSRLRADCGPDGLRGELVVRNLDRGELIVRLRRHGAGLQTMVVRPGEETVPLAPVEGPPPGYLALGVEHILGGADHLLFVAGLALLVRPALRLAGALTAFTAAHSLTLALAALGLLVLPQPPVEACIAVSLILLARALARRERPSAAAAWRLAAACGLLHGLGFAGALADIGLPRDAAVPALLAFNAGVELGQLLAAAVVLALAALARRALAASPARLAAPLSALPALALGGLAVAWTLERVLAFWSPA